MTILPDIAHVRSALLDKGGATETLTPGKLVVEMSTVGAAASLALAGDLKTRGFRMVDAPVGRPPSAARDGTLLVMAGGEARDVEEARPLFDCFADTVVHVGPQGTGIKLKLVNNYMAMVGMAMTAETLALADAVGLDRKLTVDVLRTTAAGRGQINVNFPTKVLAGDITPDFPLRMGLKDISHALDMGAQSHVPLSLGAAARVYFSLAEAWGRAEQDCTAMLLLLEDIARLEPQSSGPTKR